MQVQVKDLGTNLRGDGIAASRRKVSAIKAKYMPSMSSLKVIVWCLALPKAVVSKIIILFRVRAICLKGQRGVVVFFLQFLQTAYRLLCWMVALAEAAFSSSTHGWVKPGGELDDNISRGNCQWTKIARRQGSLGFSSRILKEAKPHSPVLFNKYSPESQLFTSNQCYNSWRLWPLKATAIAQKQAEITNI